MSVKLRQRRKGGWEIDVRVVSPDGTRHARMRKRSPLASRSDALRWAEGLERVMFQRLMDPAQQTPRKEAPTLRAFAPRFMDGHARANRQKPSGIAAKEMILRVHLLPALGHKRLDAIKSEDVQRLKRNLEAKSPKTVNNVLAVLSVLLKKAVEWEVIAHMPCTVTHADDTRQLTPRDHRVDRAPGRTQQVGRLVNRQQNRKRAVTTALNATGSTVRSCDGVSNVRPGFHDETCPLRRAARRRVAQHRSALRVTFQPRINPFRFQPNCPSSTDAYVTQLTTLARGVDRVPTDAGVRCTFRYC
jgi:hypothetical protein